MLPPVIKEQLVLLWGLQISNIYPKDPFVLFPKPLKQPYLGPRFAAGPERFDILLCSSLQSAHYCRLLTLVFQAFLRIALRHESHVSKIITFLCHFVELINAQHEMLTYSSLL